MGSSSSGACYIVTEDDDGTRERWEAQELAFGAGAPLWGRVWTGRACVSVCRCSSVGNRPVAVGAMSGTLAGSCDQRWDWERAPAASVSMGVKGLGLFC